MEFDDKKCGNCLWAKKCDEGHYTCMFKNCLYGLRRTRKNTPKEGGGEDGETKQI